MVLYSHQHAVMGMMEPAALPFSTWGGIGVMIFFAISGFLVAASWDADPHPLRYLARRALRIWPALVMVAVLTICVVGPWVTRLPASEYWLSRQTWSYFGVARLSVHRFLPGVFESNPIAHAVNGSLWTIPFEVRWYLILMALGVVGILRWRWLVLFCFVAVSWISLVRYQAGVAAAPKWVYQLGIFFLAGVVLHRFRIWATQPVGSALILAGAATASWLLGWRYLSVLLVLPFVVIWLGNQSTPLLRRMGRFGDPSYGLYLYAFPVQQLVVSLTQNRLGFWPALLVCFTVTLLLAYASWHGVEKPFLQLKRHLPYGAAPR